jgi:hypothetical protein
MRSFSWCDEEEFALDGLPHAAQVLYLRGLRKRMDYATGLVGVVFKISWQALREVVYVQPHQGTSSTGAMSKEQVRRLVGRLESAGLVEVKTEGKQLVFLLPLAKTDKSVQKKADSCPTVVHTTIPTDVEYTKANDFIDEIGGGTEKADIPQNQDTPEKPTYIRIPISGNNLVLGCHPIPRARKRRKNADDKKPAKPRKKKEPKPLPAFIPMDEWERFMEMRRDKLRARNTQRAITLIVNEIERLMLLGNDPREVIKQSCDRSWKGVYPVKKFEPVRMYESKMQAMMRRNEEAAIEAARLIREGFENGKGVFE